MTSRRRQPNPESAGARASVNYLDAVNYDRQEGESMEQWEARIDEEEGHVADFYESRHGRHILESYDPHMGNN